MSTLSPAALEEAARCACYNLRKAARAVTQHYDDHLRPTGLRSTQFSLLTLLRSTGALPLSRLAEEAVIDRTTMARNLQVLERDGLVKVRTGADARVREIELTRAGISKLEEAFPLWQRAQQSIAAELGGGRMTRLLGDLSATVDAVERR